MKERLHALTHSALSVLRQFLSLMGQRHEAALRPVPVRQPSP